MRNYDLTKLKLWANNAGFVLGESRLGVDALINDPWQDILGDFTSMSVSRSVALERSVLFRPESSTLTLTTKRADYSDSLYGLNVALEYDGTTLFTGTIRDVQTSIYLKDGKPSYSVTIQAMDDTDALQSQTLIDFEGLSPSDDYDVAEDRFYYIFDAAGRNNCFYVDEAPFSYSAIPTFSPPVTATVLELLQDVADADLARFYTTADGTVMMNADPVTEPLLAFGDQPGNLSYTSLDVSESLENNISKATVTTKYEDAFNGLGFVTGTAYADFPTITNEQTYEVALDAFNGVTNWLANFPFRGYTDVDPRKMTAPWQDEMAVLELTEVVTINVEGVHYAGGIKRITYNITPDFWNVDLDLIPAHIVKYKQDAPSPPRDFHVTANSTGTSITVGWTASADTTNLTGYELRRHTGVIQDRTQGTLVATLAPTDTTYTNTGLSYSTLYYYALFAITADSTKYSEPATLSVETVDQTPNAPGSFAAANWGSTNTNLTWTAPSNAANYDLQYYEVRRASGATAPATTSS